MNTTLLRTPDVNQKNPSASQRETLMKAWLVLQESHGRSLAFDRYFPNNTKRSNEQFNECKDAVYAILRGLSQDALELLYQHVLDGKVNEYVESKSLIGIMAAHFGTDHEETARLLLEQAGIKSLEPCIYWFRQFTYEPDCVFKQTTLNWIRHIQTERKKPVGSV